MRSIYLIIRVTCFTTYRDTPPTGTPQFLTTDFPYLRKNNAIMTANEGISYEERLDLALNALQSTQIPSLRNAAALYNVSKSTLSARLHGRVRKRVAQVNN